MNREQLLKNIRQMGPTLYTQSVGKAIRAYKMKMSREITFDEKTMIEAMAEGLAYSVMPMLAACFEQAVPETPMQAHLGNGELTSHDFASGELDDPSRFEGEPPFDKNPNPNDTGNPKSAGGTTYLPDGTPYELTSGFPETESA